MTDTSPRSHVSPGGRVIAGLSPGSIIAAALDLIDRDGLEAFSMRRLAADLGVQVGALYVHIDNKAEVLDGVADAVLREIDEVPEPPSWQEHVVAVAVAYRDVLHRHPDTAPLVTQRLIQQTAEDPPAIAQLLAALEDAGFAGVSLLDAANTLAAFLVGFTTLEFSRVRVDTDASAGNGRGFVLDPQTASEIDASFEGALRVVVTGLAATLGGDRPSASSR